MKTDDVISDLLAQVAKLTTLVHEQANQIAGLATLNRTNTMTIGTMLKSIDAVMTSINAVSSRVSLLEPDNESLH
jgi:hypothetical protein